MHCNGNDFNLCAAHSFPVFPVSCLVPHPLFLITYPLCLMPCPSSFPHSPFCSVPCPLSLISCFLSLIPRLFSLCLMQGPDLAESQGFRLQPCSSVPHQGATSPALVCDSGSHLHQPQNKVLVFAAWRLTPGPPRRWVPEGWWGFTATVIYAGGQSQHCSGSTACLSQRDPTL